MSDAVKPECEELSFGEALEELDLVVSALESGQLELEESLVRYERGVALVRSLQGKLADAQQKVTMLVGELELEAADEPQSTSTETGPDTETGAPR